VSGRQSVGPGLYEQAEDIEPSLLGERGQRFDHDWFFHISNIMELWNRVKRRLGQPVIETGRPPLPSLVAFHEQR
jgi:hypothetical protein